MQVGKGLSKDQKARKLALQHWLEAVSLPHSSSKNIFRATLHGLLTNNDSLSFDWQIDPRHRYGHNLQFYYVAWLHCESYQPFFYWYGFIFFPRNIKQKDC